MSVLLMLTTMCFEPARIHQVPKSPPKAETAITKYLKDIVLPDQWLQDLKARYKYSITLSDFSESRIRIQQSVFVFGWFLPTPEVFPNISVLPLKPKKK